MEAITLKKDEQIVLKKEDGSPIKNILVGLGWDPAQEGASVDVDLWMVPKEVSDPKADVLFFQSKNKNAEGKFTIPGMVHSGDDLTGQNSEDGPDEEVQVFGDQLLQKEYLVVANIYSSQTFGEIKRCFIEVADKDNNGKILAKYDMSESGGDNKTIVAGKITVADDKTLSFQALGKYSRLTCNDIINNPGQLFN